MAPGADLKSYEESELEEWFARSAHVEPANGISPDPRCPLSVLCSDTTVVKVVVGNEEGLKTWSIHRILLTKHSSFFRAALAPGHFVESLTNTVTLPSDDAESFEIFVQWLYTYNPETNKNALAHFQFSTISLIKAYCMGDMFGVLDFKNAVMAKLFDAHLWRHFITSFTPECLNYALENSLSGCPLQKLLADICACRILSASLSGDKAAEWQEIFDGKEEFAAAVITRVAMGSRDPPRLGHLKFHYLELWKR
ncbi:hypothetical protein MMC30_009036 [Trapelia coarctata]|nr:hypothetical protein [Trapelia coarctata]